MDNMEKQIEGIEEYEVIDMEDDTIKRRINRNRDDDKKKKIILYVIIGILLLLLGGLLVYVIFSNKDNEKDVNNNNNNEVVNGEIEEVDKDVNIGYVSCDDNTALLNVRNSTTGSIVDGLSCYKEVAIEEELEGTDACDKWYKVIYDKNGSNYTGYVCGTYIKMLDIDKTVLRDSRNIIDKVLEYYKANTTGVYCGRSGSSKILPFDNGMTGKYVKSEFKDIEELKSYVLSFLDEDLISIRLELSDIDDSKYYDNYYEIDGSLYCRNYVGSGVSSYYTGNYDIEVTSYSEDKTMVNIVYQYINKDSDCKLEDISSCKRNDFIYEIGKVSIIDGIVTKIDFYK